METRQALRRLEEAAFNAWPALQTVLLDGWVLRFAGGYTKRANSINPTYPGDATDLSPKIAVCEAIYARRGLPAIFRLTSFGVPDGLDDLLAARGYRVIDRTRVMHRSLATLQPQHTDREVRGTQLEEWLDRYVALSGATLDKRDTHAAMLRQITGVPFFATLWDGSEPVACGLAVLEGDRVGLFEIVSDRDKRNQGYGSALVREMLAWAVVNGAATAYLQVVATNESAVRLYRKLGFTDAYHYWYRVPPGQ